MITKDKILDTAESLFAELGFDNTSLRAITSEADVNLAAVNYHFGSKKELIHAVLERYLRVLMPAVDDCIRDLATKSNQRDVQALFEAMVEPMMLLERVRPNGTSVFVQLFAWAYHESQGHLKKYMKVHYGEVMRRFNSMLYTTVPHLPKSEVFWRWHFALGSCVFTMTSSKALSELAAADLGQTMHISQLIQRLIEFVAAGFSAPSDGFSAGLQGDVANPIPATSAKFALAAKR